ncbi:RNA-dependent RNA polymerase [Ascosphaera apis ARSEF 7405]|uniref:RNA-dependent RNA polymerase n=1 Tax=Ascosphaera apis ARSEF 7405 TaxID=392613 RepID=A0A162IEK8_9EURO|nr:RNA-dependent RNA polymerase [Ascosphaera apis ARSEF 7405]
MSNNKRAASPVLYRPVSPSTPSSTLAKKRRLDFTGESSKTSGLPTPLASGPLNHTSKQNELKGDPISPTLHRSTVSRRQSTESLDSAVTTSLDDLLHQFGAVSQTSRHAANSKTATPTNSFIRKAEAARLPASVHEPIGTPPSLSSATKPTSTNRVSNTESFSRQSQLIFHQSQVQRRLNDPIDWEAIKVPRFDAENYPHLVINGDIWYTSKRKHKILKPAVKRIVDELAHFGPFSGPVTFPTATPFRARYEIERVARHCNMRTQDLLAKLDCSWDDYDEFWSALRSNFTKPLEKTNPRVWKGAVNDFKSPDDDDSVVTLSAELTRSEEKRSRFALTVNTMKYERSHRFGRRFGSDRFLELIVPQVGRMSKDEHEAVTRWLATCKHYLFGRTWRAFYFENRKAVGGKLTAKVTLFAVDGDDFIKPLSQPGHLDVAPQGQLSSSHTPMTLEAMINWLIPFNKNDKQKDLKLFQRIHLGLSRTTPTAVLQKDEIFFVPDMKSPTGETMNDGCSLMSRSLAHHISAMLSLSHMPAAFQARISGAKGMWIVDKNDSRHPTARNFWVEINESQLKILPPPSEDERELDSEQLTFGVVKWFESLAPAELNMQLLKVLQHGGIKKEHVEELVKYEIDLVYQEFKSVVKPNKMIQTRKWLQRWLRKSRTEQKDKRVDEAFPLNDASKALTMVDAGFTPLGVPYLQQIFSSLLSDYFNQLESLHLKVSCSTYAFCIADPYGVLEPGEVHLGFSRAWEDGFFGTELDDIDVLVARLPAHVPTDIQKRRAVYKRELAHLKDVMVFPTTGDIPLASELSGGDYDGDTVWKLGVPKLPELAHKKRDDALIDYDHIIDYLKFKVIDEEKSRVLSDFKLFCGDTYQKDEDLMQPWLVAQEKLGKDVHIMDPIRAQIQRVRNQWICCRSRSRQSDTKSYESDVLSAIDNFNAIKPPKSTNPLCIAWEYCPNEWKLVRSSYAYSLMPQNKFVFLMAGYELCVIKAKSKGDGQWRVVVSEIHSALRASRNSVKAIEVEDMEEQGDVVDASATQSDKDSA